MSRGGSAGLLTVRLVLRAVGRLETRAASSPRMKYVWLSGVACLNPYERGCLFHMAIPWCFTTLLFHSLLPDREKFLSFGTVACWLHLDIQSFRCPLNAIFVGSLGDISLGCKASHSDNRHLF